MIDRDKAATLVQEITAKLNELRGVIEKSSDPQDPRDQAFAQDFLSTCTGARRMQQKLTANECPT